MQEKKSLLPAKTALILAGLASLILASSCPSFISPNVVSAPIISPGTGTYGSVQSVTIVSYTPSAIIRYTLDGSLPTVTSGILYSGAFSVSTTTTVKAIASRSGYADSSVTSALITIVNADLEFGYSSASPVMTVDFSGFGDRTIILSGAAGRSVYLVKSNLSSLAAPASDSGGLASEISPDLSSRSGIDASSLSRGGPYYLPLASGFPGDATLGVSSRGLRLNHEEAEAFNASPPPVPEYRRSGKADGSKAAVVVYGAAAPGLAVDSSYKEFWIEASKTGPWIQIRATLRAVGEYCYIWVADANYDAASADPTDNKVTKLRAEQLRDKFDGTLPPYANGIFRNVTGIFGSEYGGGTGGSGGMDADQHISILVFDIYQDQTPSQTGGYLGYFFSVDEYTQATLDGIYGKDKYKSNLAEIFYLDSHFTDKEPGWIYSTLAHEFQHMIHYNRKNIQSHVGTVPPWINELCSMVAEDLVDRNIGLDPETEGPRERLEEFNYHYFESGVSDWLASPSTLKSYAGAFAFGAYLSRNYGGADFFSALLSNDSTGVPSITEALSDQGSGDTFEDAFSRYGEAFVFGDRPSGSSVKTLKQEVTSTIGGIAYTAESIDLWDIDQYDLDTKTMPGVKGPRILDPLDKVELRPWGLSIHSRPEWKALSGDLAISLAAPVDPDVVFTLMVK